MAEYIEREALLNRIKALMKRITPIEESRDMFYHDSGVNGALTGAVLEVKSASAADVVEVKRGKWYGGGGEWACTQCGCQVFEHRLLTNWPYNFCPRCGADMRKETDRATD